MSTTGSMFCETCHCGAYMNEADPFEPDPVNTFGGRANFDRLLRIEQEIDPKNIMKCLRCVGYDPADSRHQCYPTM